MQDRQGRRKSWTSLKIFKETHRIVLEPGTKRRSRAAEKRRERKRREEKRREEKRREKRCYRRQDEGTRILFKAKHFTAARSASGNGGSSPATPEELIRG